jgi:hypothetical protein
VIEAMPKPAVDIDEGAAEPAAESPSESAPIPFRRP